MEEDALDDLSTQMLMFSHQPTKQAWDVIQGMLATPDVQLHPNYKDVKEKIDMWESAVLNRHPDWSMGERHDVLKKQWPVRSEWLLSKKGDKSPSKVTFVWFSYFATGEDVYVDKIVSMTEDLTIGESRMTALKSLFIISQDYPVLAERWPNKVEMGKQLVLRS